ncbi:MAG: heavy-metal-associated domain-containing protein [Succinivibrionaceae bacterium]|nr:heavy-metal-associated domain-containing protein [Succinivibrionaceae bacterium]
MATKTIKVEGMHCEHCVASVERALSAIPTATGVKVSLERGEATLEVADAIPDALLVGAITGAGFKAGAVS